MDSIHLYSTSSLTLLSRSASSAALLPFWRRGSALWQPEQRLPVTSWAEWWPATERTGPPSWEEGSHRCHRSASQHLQPLYYSTGATLYLLRQLNAWPSFSIWSRQTGLIVVYLNVRMNTKFFIWCHHYAPKLQYHSNRLIFKATLPKASMRRHEIIFLINGCPEGESALLIEDNDLFKLMR